MRDNEHIRSTTTSDVKPMNEQKMSSKHKGDLRKYSKGTTSSTNGLPTIAGSNSIMFCVCLVVVFSSISVINAQDVATHSNTNSGKSIGVPIPLSSTVGSSPTHSHNFGVPINSAQGFRESTSIGVPLHTAGGTSATTAGHLGAPLNGAGVTSGATAGNIGVPLGIAAGASRTTGNFGVGLNTAEGTSRTTSGNFGVPLSSAIGGGVSTAAAPTAFGTPLNNGFGTTKTTTSNNFGVPLRTVTGNSFTTSVNSLTTSRNVGVSLNTAVGNSGGFNTFVGRGIQETKPQGNFGPVGSHGPNAFHINHLPSSIELDKNLSPVPPYFVFSDDSSSVGSLTIGGPKSGGLVPITNPTGDPKLLRLLSQPTVRHRLTAEAKADKALKISAILMAHRQVVGGQITYVSVRVAETNCPASRIHSLRGCTINPSLDSYICEIAFWERPWLNATRILDEKTACAEIDDDLEFDAEPPRSGRVLAAADVGGRWAPATALPAGVTEQQLAIEAFTYVDERSDSRFRGHLAGHTVRRVVVDVARNLSKVDVVVDYGLTVCLKLDWTDGGQKDPRSCPPDTTRGGYTCAVTLLYHPHQLMPLHILTDHDDEDHINCVRKARLSLPPGHLQTHPASLGLAGEASAQARGEGKGVPDCPGCPVQAALSDPAIQPILAFAVAAYDAMFSDDANLHKPVALLRAYTQATVGTKYLLTVELAETVCRKGVPGVVISQCPEDLTEERQICDLTVLHQPWLPSSHLLHAKCYDKSEYMQRPHDLLHAFQRTLPPSAAPTAHSSVGVPLPVPSTTAALKPVSLSLSTNGTTAAPLDAQSQRLVQFVVEQINIHEARSDFDDSQEIDDSLDYPDGYYKLVKVHQVSDLFGGQQRRVVVEVGETNCSRGFFPPGGASYAHCALDPFEEHEVCDAVVTLSNGPGVSGASGVNGVTGVNGFILSALYCDDLGDYLSHSSLVPNVVPSVTWVPVPFLPVGHLRTLSRPLTHTGFSTTITGPYASMKVASATAPGVRKAGELVVARHNLLSGEDQLAVLTGVLTAHTMTGPSGELVYLLEVELAETHCKKYLPIIDPRRCPVDHTEDRIVCQAEVVQQQGAASQQQQQQQQQQSTWDGLSVNKLYCRDRDDYIVTRATGEDGPWTNIPATDPKAIELARYTADQYDLRSDDDDLFVVHRIVSAKKQSVSGARFRLVVELAETVCPKYKDTIHKSRCRVDPTEDIKVCSTELWESPSSGARLSMISLRCSDKQQRRRGSSSSSSAGFGVHHDSVETLVLPSVHPSAHARPLFLNKFKKIKFRESKFTIIHHDDSLESRESNELRSTHRGTQGPLRSIHRGTHRGFHRGFHRSSHRSTESKESAESNEQFYRHPHGRGGGGAQRRRWGEDSRSDEDDSDEFFSNAFKFAAAFRGR